jgi:membrane fusion protein, macrolide-specific efflux system
MKALPRRLRAHPRWTAVGTLVVLGGAGIGGYAAFRGGGAAAAAASTTVQTLSTGTIRQSVSATGTLAPAKQESLSFPVSGEVTAVSVSAGQRVKKGQTLATIDAASLAVDVAQAEATVANDEAKVDADATDGASDTQVAADDAALTAAKNQLASAKSQLAQATMTAPIDGVVAEVNLTVGQTVSGSSSSSGSGSGSASGSGGSGSGATAGLGATSSGSSSSSAQILVISTDSWIVNATVDATSVGLIHKGNQAQLTVTGAAATVYGTIASVGLVSSSSSGTASYPVVVDVTGSPAGLHDGAGVTATLIYKQLGNVVVIPSTALHRDTTGQYVERSVNGKAVRTPVQVGISSLGQVQITSGLAAGDQIIVPQLAAVRGTGGATTNRGTGTRAPGGQFPGGQFPGGQFPGGQFQLPGGGTVQLPAGGGGGG